MHTDARVHSELLVLFVLLGLPPALVASGCGGSSSPVEPPPGPMVQSSPFYFHADLRTGQVTALEPGDPRLAGIETVSPQVVGTNTGGGAPLEVKTASILTSAGNPGRRVVSTWVKNNTKESVGELPGGQRNGIDLVFTSLVFRDASNNDLAGGSVVAPTKYDPGSGLPVITIPGRLGPGQSSGSVGVVFSLPKNATQVVWGVIARTDTAWPGTYPQPGNGCWVTTVAGGGADGFSDGPAHLARFHNPSGLAVAADGSVLISDAENDALRELLPSGVVRTVPDLGVNLDWPCDVTIDLANSTPTSQIVYLACGGTADRVYRIVRDPTTNSTTSVTTIAGAGADPDATTGDNLDLQAPQGLDADRCNGVWVADTGYNRLYHLRLEPGANPRSATAAQYQVVLYLNLADADDCTVDDFGNAFVIEDTGDALHRLGADNTLTTISIPGISVPACAVNGAGTVCYIKDMITDRVRQVRLTGADPTNAASWTVEDLTKGGSGYRDGPGGGAQFYFGDEGMDLDSSGALWVVDGVNNYIRRIDRLAGA